MTTAVAVWFLAMATATQAMDTSAYARLLEAHVRPGVIGGTRLTVVDYRGIQSDPNYGKALQWKKKVGTVAGKAYALDEAARTFLANPAKGLVPGRDGKTAKVSSIFKWFGDDFGAVGRGSKFILTKAEPALAARIAGLTEAGLSYLEYDWSLNDSARSK